MPISTDRKREILKARIDRRHDDCLDSDLYAYSRTFTDEEFFDASEVLLGMANRGKTHPDPVTAEAYRTFEIETMVRLQEIGRRKLAVTGGGK